MSILEMRVPTIGESISEVTLSQWLKADGDIVNIDEPICEFESDKATLEFPAEATGKLIYVAAEGDDLEIGALVAKIDTSVSGEGNVAESKSESVEEPVEDPVEKKEEVKKEDNPISFATGHPSPAAQKIMAEKGISSSDISGSGKDGRITKDDAVKATKIESTQTKETPIPNTADTMTAKAFSRNTRLEKMSRMRRTIASRLVSAKNSTAMLTTFNEVDLTNIMELRKNYQEKFLAKYGIKLGYMSLFSKACAQALLEMPAVNAQIDGTDIIYHDFVDISIAISTPSGLVVPPVRNVESMNFAEIEQAIKELSVKARDGKLTLEEMKGGTFTITNGGIFGSMMSTPIINEPQSAILGMHNIIQRPMVVNGEIVARPMMYLALSYDHRIIDGSTSVTFLVRVKNLLEDPMQLLMGL